MDVKATMLHLQGDADYVERSQRGRGGRGRGGRGAGRGGGGRGAISRRRRAEDEDFSAIGEEGRGKRRRRGVHRIAASAALQTS